MLEEKNGGAQAEKLALSQFLLVHPVENECVFGRLRTLLDVSGGFAELSHVTTERRAMRMSCVLVLLFLVMLHSFTA